MATPPGGHQYDGGQQTPGEHGDNRFNFPSTPSRQGSQQPYEPQQPYPRRQAQDGGWQQAQDGGWHQPQDGGWQQPQHPQRPHRIDSPQQPRIQPVQPRRASSLPLPRRTTRWSVRTP